MFYVYVYLLCINAAYLYNNAIRTLEIPTHLEMDVVVVVNIREMNSLHIGTLVVVCNRAVIENQSCVCLVVCKDVILAVWTVFRQKQCHPAPQHYLVFFESASCKNSETSCLESRRKFDGVKLTRNRYMQLHDKRIVQIANITDTTQ